MILQKDKKSKKGKIVVEICDNCFSFKRIAGTIKGIELCKDCFFNKSRNEIVEKFNPIKRLKWYEILFQYQEKDYKLVDWFKRGVIT